MSSNSRQRVEHVAGARRAKLTAAPGTTEEPTGSDDSAPPAEVGGDAESGPNDARMRQDKPPHY